MLAARLSLAGKYRTVVNFGDLAEPYVPSTFVAANDFLKDKPNLVQAFVTGLFRGVSYLKKNETYAIGVLEKVTGESDAAVLKTVYKEIILTLGDDGKASRADIEAAIKLTALAGVTDPPGVDSLMDPGAIKK